MYAQIVIDCQTQTENISCEFCIANKTCELRKGVAKNKQTANSLEIKTGQIASQLYAIC
jgi:hypothetical protein